MCADINKIKLNVSCYDQCSSHYYAQDRLCYICHSTCLDCSNSTRKSLPSCDTTRFFYQSQCLGICPEGIYEKDGICIDCSIPCEKCTSRLDCITCADNYYKIENKASYVVGEECLSRTYPDDETKTYADCYYTCLTCSGSTSSDCIICNFGLGYSKNSDEVGECHMLVCIDGMYIHIDNVLQKAWCKFCHESCATCDEGGEEYCITCNNYYQAFDSSVKNHQICKSCTDVNSGYQLSSDSMSIYFLESSLPIFLEPVLRQYINDERTMNTMGFLEYC